MYVSRNAAICEAIDCSLFVPGNPTITVGGVEVPPCIVADGRYPLRRRLMKPFGGPGDRRIYV